MTAPINEKGMLQARRRARFELGDPSWAGIIINAYLNPERDAEQLREDMAE